MSARLSIALLLICTLSLVVSACGNKPLEGIGDRSRQLFDQADDRAPRPGSPSPTSPATETELWPATAVSWLNQDASYWGSAGLDRLTSDEVIDIIWAGSSKRDSFVQVSPREVAAALPGLQFPDLVPASVQHVTSQLVFVVPGGDLAADFVAAFGFWTVAPYSQSRSTGQRMVLWVALGGPPPAPAEQQGSECPDFEIADTVSCHPQAVGTIQGWWYELNGGGRLVWSDGPYRYELFHRNVLPERVAIRIAESMRSLATLADDMPSPSAG